MMLHHHCYKLGGCAGLISTWSRSSSCSYQQYHQYHQHTKPYQRSTTSNESHRSNTQRPTEKSFSSPVEPSVSRRSSSSSSSLSLSASGAYPEYVPRNQIPPELTPNMKRAAYAAQTVSSLHTNSDNLLSSTPFLYSSSNKQQQRLQAQQQQLHRKVSPSTTSSPSRSTSSVSTSSTPPSSSFQAHWLENGNQRRSSLSGPSSITPHRSLSLQERVHEQQQQFPAFLIPHLFVSARTPDTPIPPALPLGPNFDVLLKSVTDAKADFAKIDDNRRTAVAMRSTFAQQLTVIMNRAQQQKRKGLEKKREEALNRLTRASSIRLGSADPLDSFLENQLTNNMQPESEIEQPHEIQNATLMRPIAIDTKVEWNPIKEDLITQQHLDHKKEVEVATRQTVGRLAGQMGVSAKDVLEKLHILGHRATKLIDFVNEDIAEIIVMDFDMIPVKPNTISMNTSGDIPAARRGPVICVMGHVDHGKTTLLDTLRREQRALYEAGHITQSIGAFRVDLSSQEGSNNNNKNNTDDQTPTSIPASTSTTFTPSSGLSSEDLNSIDAAATIATFLDTPGHAAFRAMRERGANSSCTDLIVLVISAVDGIQPQTVEVIELAQQFEVPIIVAINKCDLAEANPQRIREQLCMYDVITEEMGGDVLAVEISAKLGTGIKELKEAILLASDMLDLKAPNNGDASAYVIETSRQRNMGCVINLVVRKGELKVGDYFVCGLQYGPIRALIDERSQKLTSARPSMGIQLIGASDLDDMTEELISVDTEEEAQKIVAHRKASLESGEMDNDMMIADDLALQPKLEPYRIKKMGRRNRFRVAIRPITAEEKLQEQQVAASTISFIIKADVNGSLEALLDYIQKLPQDEVKVNVLRSDIGEINETDIIFAEQMNAAVIGFNVPISASTATLAKNKHVTAISKDVIYYVMDEIRDMASAKLPIEIESRTIGMAEIKQVFSQRQNRSRASDRVVAGIQVIQGEIKHHGMFRVRRDEVVLYNGGLHSMRHLTKEVQLLKKGDEGGLLLDGYNDYELGDIIECVVEDKISRVIDDSAARGYETVANPKYELDTSSMKEEIMKKKKRQAQELQRASTMSYLPAHVRARYREVSHNMSNSTNSTNNNTSNTTDNSATNTDTPKYATQRL